MSTAEITEQAEAQQPWVRPDVKLGDRVVMARGLGDLNSPASTRRYAAIVTKVSNRTIEAVVLPHGERSLFHADDPELEKNPQWLAEDDTGVWRLAESEGVVKDLQAEVVCLRSKIAEALVRIAAMERDLKSVADVKRRGPGRPPKTPDDD